MEKNVSSEKLHLQRRGDAAKAVVILVALLVASLALVIAFVMQPGTTGCGLSCPAGFGVFNQTRVPAGSIGCQSVAGEVCYSVLMISEIDGLRLSDLSFKLLAPCSCDNVLNGTPIPVGEGAKVSVVSSPHSIIDAWNWSVQTWIQGGGWQIPVGTDVTLVFDSNLQGISLAGDLFWAFLSAPGSGSAGVYLS